MDASGGVTCNGRAARPTRECALGSARARNGCARPQERRRPSRKGRSELPVRRAGFRRGLSGTHHCGAASASPTGLSETLTVVSCGGVSDSHSRQPRGGPAGTLTPVGNYSKVLDTNLASGATLSVSAELMPATLTAGGTKYNFAFADVSGGARGLADVHHGRFAGRGATVGSNPINIVVVYLPVGAGEPRTVDRREPAGIVTRPARTAPPASRRSRPSPRGSSPGAPRPSATLRSRRHQRRHAFGRRAPSNA